MNNNNQFIFSVIMAIYNVEKYLDEAIQSVINQKLSFLDNIQLVLINDGSPDNCDVICKKYKKMYPSNVIYIKQENGGVSSARNAGLDVATGKYINFLDSDDYFSDNAFSEVKKSFEKYKNKTDVVAINLINFENSEGSWVNGAYFKETQLIDMEKESNFMQCQVGASFIKSEVAKKYRFDTNMKIHEDSHYLYRIFCSKPSCGTVSKATYWHRIRANGTSATQTIKHKTNIFSITKKLFIELVDFYLINYSKVPDFLQTFIILEFNYYVISKIKQCEFSRREKRKLKKDIKHILENISNESILNHFVLKNPDKETLCKAKENINILFDEEEKITVSYFFKGTMYGFLRIYNVGICKAKSLILWIPKRLVRRTLRSTLNRIELLELKLNEMSNAIVETNNNLEKNYNTVTETSRSIEKINVILDDKNNNVETVKCEIAEIKNNIEIIHSSLDESKNNLEKNRNTIVETNGNINEIHNIINRTNDKIKTEILEIKNEIGFYEDIDIKYCLYFHGGSKNHGCEALIKTITKVLDEKRENFLLHTFRKSEDVLFKINEEIKYIKEPVITDSSKKIAYMGETMFNDDMGIPDISSLLNSNSIALSIGGDNYCYGNYVTNLLSNYNKEFHKLNVKTCLIGCSIEPEVLKDKNILRDLNNYDLILARETITYNELLKVGIDKNTHLVPDSAFILKKVDLPLPKNFIIDNTIGLNISPLVQSDNTEDNIVFKNYIQLINHIINKTEYNIALIPHVLWQGGNDIELLTKLYNQFCHTGRVVLILEHNCEELKGYISRCKMFIGARTHATIAAYSSCVPTVAIGYSVKSKGIALDLFGTYENYVLSITDILGETNLIDSFLWLEKNYDNIKKHLQETIPNYIKPLENLPKYFKDLRSKRNVKELPYKPDCTGCNACCNICPQKCITMVNDNEGFMYPEVNYEKCTNCNLCKNICPRNNTMESNPHQNAFAVKNKDITTRNESSSGGVFTELAKYVLNNHGVVFGAAYNDSMEVEHIKIDNIKYLFKLQGSKYVQSNIGTSFEDVEEELIKNKLVLFSGVPCHIQGLKQFLQKDYSNLICIDVVCHGVPSPKVFNNYLASLENMKNCKITNLYFRNKDDGWKKYNLKILYTNKEQKVITYSDDLYMKGFLQNLYLRPSCHNCTANNFRSGSDITLGDYWGIEKLEKDFDDDKGVSLVLLNTKQGEEVFNEILHKFDILKTDINFAIKNNPSIVKCWNPHKNRQQFFDRIDETDIMQNIEKNLN